MEELRWATANRWAGPRSAGLFTAGNWETSIGGIVTSSFKKHLVATHLQKNVSTGNSHKCPQREGKHTNYPKMFETTKLQANMLKKCLTFCKRSTSNCPQWNTKMPNKKNQHGKKQKKKHGFHRNSRWFSTPITFEIHQTTVDHPRGSGPAKHLEKLNEENMDIEAFHIGYWS